MAEIKVRNVDERALQIIEQRAKQKGMSRNTYLNELIRFEVENHLLKHERVEMQMLLNRVADAFEITMQQTKNMEVMYQKMFVMTAMLIDIEALELDRVLTQMIKKEE